MVGVTLLYQGRLVPARAALERALGSYDPGAHREHVLASGMDNGVHVLNHLAPTLWMLGLPDAGLRTTRRALDRARELGHPISTGLALHFACQVHELRREWDAVGRLAEELLALGARHAFPHFLAWGRVQRGAALVARGEVAAGVADMRRGLADLRRAGDEVWRPFYATLLARALKEADRTEEGLAVLAEAQAQVDNGERVHEAEVHRTAGELLLATAGGRDEGEAHLLRAMEVARTQQAKSWELRAATSLARARAGWGRRGEARDLLASAYEWFAEGFDTPDLRDAKVLIEASS
jgi:adenylate cyclase